MESRPAISSLLNKTNPSLLSSREKSSENKIRQKESRFLFRLSFSNVKSGERGMTLQELGDRCMAWACSGLHREDSSTLARCFKHLSNLIILWKRLGSFSLVP